MLFGCGQPQLQVTVPLAVVNFAPHDGAVGIDPATVPAVCFNRPMDAAAASGALSLEGESGGAVPGLSIVAGGDNHCLLLQHEALAGDTGYVIRLRSGLASADGAALATDLASRFRTAAR